MTLNECDFTIYKRRPYITAFKNCYEPLAVCLETDGNSNATHITYPQKWWNFDLHTWGNTSRAASRPCSRYQLPANECRLAQRFLVSGFRCIINLMLDRHLNPVFRVWQTFPIAQKYCPKRRVFKSSQDYSFIRGVSYRTVRAFQNLSKCSFIYLWKG